MAAEASGLDAAKLTCLMFWNVAWTYGLMRGLFSGIRHACYDRTPRNYRADFRVKRAKRWISSTWVHTPEKQKLRKNSGFAIKTRHWHYLLTMTDTRFWQVDLNDQCAMLYMDLKVWPFSSVSLFSSFSNPEGRTCRNRRDLDLYLIYWHIRVLISWDIVRCSTPSP
jgi:hypothetical protein